MQRCFRLANPWLDEQGDFALIAGELMMATMKTLSVAGAALSGLPAALSQGTVQSAAAQLMHLAEMDARHVTTLSAALNIAIDNMYAGHRSHSSHSSHSSHYSSSSGGHSSDSSHSSQYSGSGAIYREPQPPPAAAPLQPSPARAPSTKPSTTTKLSGYPSDSRQDQLAILIMRVQAALYSKGYDPGAIDGNLGLQTRAALSSFQAAQGLPSTGSMTTETLNALGVALPK